MLRTLLLLTSLVFLLGCTQEVVEPTLPLSKIVINNGGEALYDISYSAHELAPSTGHAKEDYPNFMIYSPSMFLPTEVANIPNDLDFHFMFYDVEMEYTSEPFLEDFWTYLEKNPAEFNKAPFKRNFFLKVEKDGKIYQNWWKGGYLVAHSDDRTYDETGLTFKNSKITRFDEFEELNRVDGNFSVLRIQGELEGLLVTEDGEDTLEVDGELDVFVHIF